jgi:hypothetical protein
MTRPFQRARNVSLLEIAAKAMGAVKSLEVPREGLPACKAIVGQITSAGLRAT